MIHGSLNERERERYIYTYVKPLNISIFLVGHLRLAMRTGGQVWRKHGKKNMARIIHGKKREDTMISYVYN